MALMALAVLGSGIWAADKAQSGAKPARASWLQREALKLTYRALQEAGIEFANSSVMVRSGDLDPNPVAHRGAAAGQLALEQERARLSAI